MTHGSLFSGIGGFDLAAEWAGWTNVFHCEINPFGQRVLKYYWPKAISYDDITKTDFTIHRGAIDVLTGGFPCQPFSVAGKRKGTADHRNLWPEYFRAIKEIQPLWVVGENVPGLINWSAGMVFEQVQADLESEGYEVWPVILPACGVNAPHRRDRVWFVAYRDSNGLNRSNCTHGEYAGERWQYAFCNIIKSIDNGTTPNTSDTGLQGSENIRSTGSIRQERNKQFTGLLQPTWQNFPTQSPICAGNDGFPARLDGITFSKWRNESIKAAGNAIVPQVAFQIFNAINQLKQ